MSTSWARVAHGNLSFQTTDCQAQATIKLADGEGRARTTTDDPQRHAPPPGIRKLSTGKIAALQTKHVFLSDAWF